MTEAERLADELHKIAYAKFMVNQRYGRRSPEYALEREVEFQVAALLRKQENALKQIDEYPYKFGQHVQRIKSIARNARNGG